MMPTLTDVGRQTCPHRRVFTTAAAVIAVAGLVGTGQLVTGTMTPPNSDLDRLGLDSWVLPGVWLFASVVVPWSAGAWAAFRRWSVTPMVVVAAAILLIFELAVQVPFLGFSPFQPIMALAALSLGLLGWRDRFEWKGMPG